MLKRPALTALLFTATLVVLTSCSQSAVVTSPTPAGQESVAPSPSLADPSAPHSVCVDQLGDVTGLDLASATLTLEPKALNFTITTAAPPAGYAAYDLELVDNKAQPLYNFSLIFNGSSAILSGIDFATNEKFPVTPDPQISGDTVSGKIPLSDVPHLPPAAVGFQWSANAGGKAGSDRCPDTGSDTTRPAMETFPN
jgi:hypothetical protein